MLREQSEPNERRPANERTASARAPITAGRRVRANPAPNRYATAASCRGRGPDDASTNSGGAIAR